MRKLIVSAALAVVAAVFPLSGFTPAAHASAGNPDQVCPFVPNTTTDPDFVSYLGPDAIPGDGATHTVQVFASESPDEVAGNSPNVVTLAVIALGSDNSITTGFSSNPQSTVVSLALPGTLGVTYTLHWVTVFDYAVHPCASVLPGHAPFTVTVFDPDGR